MSGESTAIAILKFIMRVSKQEIIKEIKRLAEANGKIAPGIVKFERETGITKSNWYGIYWSRWGDAIFEAGYSPNTKQQKLSSDEALRHFAESVRYFGRIPSEGDLRIYGREKEGFPGHTTFRNHFGSKAGR